MTRGLSSSASALLKVQAASPGTRFPRPRNCPQSPVPTTHASQTTAVPPGDQVPPAKESGQASNGDIPGHALMALPISEPQLLHLYNGGSNIQLEWTQKGALNTQPKRDSGFLSLERI